MARYCYFLLCFFMLTACAAQKRAEKSRQAALRYGMTHAEALALITDRSEILLGEFNFPEGRMEAYQYARYGAAAFKVPKYYLYFLNDTLVRKSPEEDLRQGAKLALKDHEQYLKDREEEAQHRAGQAARKAEEAEKKAAQAEKRDAQKSAEAARRNEAARQKAASEEPRKKHTKKQSSDEGDDEDEW